MRSLLQSGFFDVASLGIGVAALILSISVCLGLYLVLRRLTSVMREVPGLLTSVASLSEETEADWGAKGGLNRAANMQAAKILSQIERAIFDSEVPFGKFIRQVAEKFELPLDEWIDTMPFGLIALVKNPKAQDLFKGVRSGLAGLLGQAQQSEQPINQGW